MMVVTIIMIAVIIVQSTIVVVISMNIYFEIKSNLVWSLCIDVKFILKFVKMILMATMFDFSLEEQRGLIGFLNSWNYGVSLYIIISFFTVIICREMQFICIFFRFPFGWEDKGTPGEGM